MVLSGESSGVKVAYLATPSISSGSLLAARVHLAAVLSVRLAESL